MTRHVSLFRAAQRLHYRKQASTVKNRDKSYFQGVRDDARAARREIGDAIIAGELTLHLVSIRPRHVARSNRRRYYFVDPQELTIEAWERVIEKGRPQRKDPPTIHAIARAQDKFLNSAEFNTFLRKKYPANPDGRPPKWDWPTVEQYFINLLDAHGPYGKGRFFQNQNAAVANVAQFCGDTFGDEPQTSLLKLHIARWYAAWSAARRAPQ